MLLRHGSSLLTAPNLTRINHDLCSHLEEEEAVGQQALAERGQGADQQGSQPATPRQLEVSLER